MEVFYLIINIKSTISCIKVRANTFMIWLKEKAKEKVEEKIKAFILQGTGKGPACKRVAGFS